MYRGGIYDHIGFGFARYATDEKWLVPHFEKMLYDNALLALAYIEAYQATGNEFYARAAREIFTYVRRDMTAPEGGFYSAEDADSEGVEGKFYVWTPAEIKKVLGERDGAIYCRLYDITPEGNFEGYSIPNLIRETPESAAARFDMEPEELAILAEGLRKKLFAAREKRVHPFKDDKVLTSWNGLMISALARGGQVLAGDVYTSSASRAADFILSRMKRDGYLLHRYCRGEAAYKGFLDDYAYLVAGLLDLYEAIVKPCYLAEAVSLNSRMLALFWDEQNRGLFFSSKEAEEELPFKAKDAYDGALPSGNSVAALNMLRIAHFTGDKEMGDKALRLMESFSASIHQAPSNYTAMLSALDFSLGPVREMVLIGRSLEEDTERALLRVIQKQFLPRKVFLFYSPEQKTGYELEQISAPVKDKEFVDGKPALYLCENFSCRVPFTNKNELEAFLTQEAGADRDNKTGEDI